MFLENAWYCAGWEETLKDKPAGVKIIGKHIVVFKTSDGQLKALDGRCPHRFAPFSEGKIINDHLQCPYHGLEFSSDGKCALNPHGDGVIPPRADLRSSPVTVRNRAIFVWMGDPEKADKRLLPSPENWAEVDTHYKTGVGQLTINANYQLVIDNLLDGTHAAYLHPTTLANPMEDTSFDEIDLRTDGTLVLANYKIYSTKPTPQLDLVWDRDKGDMYLDMTLTQPSSLYLNAGMTEEGGTERERGVRIPSFHFLSPIDEFTTQYYFCFGRNVAQDDDEVDQKMMAIGAKAFMQEDEPMIRACQTMMDTSDLMSLRPIILQTDYAAIQARRILDKMIREEARN